MDKELLEPAMKMQKKHHFAIPFGTFGTLAWLSFILCCYFLMDQHLAELIHEIQIKPYKKVANVISWLGLGAPYLIFFSLLILASQYVFHHKIWRARGWLFLMAVVLPGIVCVLLKPVFGRSRIKLLFNQHIYGFHWFSSNFEASYYSFPSGHATTIAALMTVCIILWPRWFYCFLFIMITVCFSRIYTEQHFLSDTLLGIYLGSAGSMKIYDVFIKKGWSVA